MTYRQHNIYINIAYCLSAVLCVNNAQYFYMCFGENTLSLNVHMSAITIITYVCRSMYQTLTRTCVSYYLFYVSVI